MRNSRLRCPMRRNERPLATTARPGEASMITGECRVETRGPDGRAIILEGLRLRLDLRLVRRSTSETADGGTETLLEVEEAALLALPGHWTSCRRWTVWAGGATVLLAVAVWLVIAFTSDPGSTPARPTVEQHPAAPAAPGAPHPASRASAPSQLSGLSQASERGVEPVITPGPKDAAPPGSTPGSPVPQNTGETARPASGTLENAAQGPAPIPATTRAPSALPATPSRPRPEGVPPRTRELPLRRTPPPTSALTPLLAPRPEPRTTGSQRPDPPRTKAPASTSGPLLPGTPDAAGRYAASRADRLDLFDDTQ
jgi:hypothetical protein